MRLIHMAFGVSVIVLTALAGQSYGQSVLIGPGGIQVTPRDRRPVPPAYARDELRREMFHLRAECDEGERRACVRLGIIIGEHREHVAEWRREHPELFFYER
jgi:hypothetical protein